MKKKRTLSKVFSYIGRYKFLLPISLLLALVTVALTLYVPILIGEAITVIENLIVNGDNGHFENGETRRLRFKEHFLLILKVKK